MITPNFNSDTVEMMLHVATRVEAERMVLHDAAAGRVPAVAMCVSNTYGPGDNLPTPHDGMVAAAVRGRLPFYVSGWDAEAVGVRDAARALVYAGERLHHLRTVHEYPRNL